MTKRIIILATDNAIAGGIITLKETFDHCNTYWRRVNAEPVDPLFECAIVSPDGKTLQTSNGYPLPSSPLRDWGNFENADAVVVASALAHDLESIRDYIVRFKPFVGPLKTFSQSGRYVGSYCSGTLVLASTGLLDNRAATCSWWAAGMCRQMFPAVKLNSNEVIVRDDTFITAGAASANLNLGLTLIRHLTTERIANHMAKLLLITPNRLSQNLFSDTSVLMEHQDELIQNIQRWIRANLKQTITLDAIADKFALGKRTLMRRFKSSTSETLAHYIQRLKVDEAKVLLETSRRSVQSIAQAVGYEDVGAFRKCFIKYTSVSPNVYRKTFRVF